MEGSSGRKAGVGKDDSGARVGKLEGVCGWQLISEN